MPAIAQVAAVAVAAAAPAEVPIEAAHFRPELGQAALMGVAIAAHRSVPATVPVPPAVPVHHNGDRAVRLGGWDRIRAGQTRRDHEYGSIHWE